jgi:acylphosphatase
LHRGLGGSVRNLSNGHVEAIFEGDPGAIDSMIQWCRQGPSAANVQRVEVTEEQPTGEARFVIAR